MHAHRAVESRHGLREAWNRLATVLTLALVAGTACTRPQVKMLTSKRYAPRPPSYPIDLFETEVQTAHEEIAIVDTIAVELLTSETQFALVENLRKRARAVGADAVKNVAMLMRADRGWIPDPQTPFSSWRQGWTDLYFLRGRAIRFKPIRIEAGEGAIAPEPFDWGAGERPSAPKPGQPEIEIYEVRDRFGRRGYASRPVGAQTPKTPQIETGK